MRKRKGPVLRILIVALLAPLGVAFAQSSDEQPIATQPAFAFEADLSPSGRRLAYTRQENGDLFLVVADVGKELVDTAKMPVQSDARLSLEWQDDDQLLYAVRDKDDYDVWSNTGDSVLLLAFQPEYSVVSPDLSHPIQLLTPKDLRGMPKASEVVSKSPDASNRVLISGWGERGITRALYSVSLDDGSFERMDRANRETLSWSLDGLGRPVLRLDRDQRGTELRLYSSLSVEGAERRWEEVGRYPVIDSQISTAEIVPLSSGPGENQVYVMARRGDSSRRGVYIFDVSQGGITSEVFLHDQWDVDAAILDDTGRHLLAVRLGDEARSLLFVDPTHQRHMQALKELAGADVRLNFKASDANGSQWLFTAQGPRLGTNVFLYDVARSHVRVLLTAPDLIQ